ncbi:SDR family NAD(P)-dependent oxidoreductase [Leifsonia sp. NPDC058248]|uniref:SDR family NAD(P)-dependent oxidoreductase n=1 Tax=Leifsonia sp. NPDC058248 TaxID=3346402 RepID=UPI0036DF8B0D
MPEQDGRVALVTGGSQGIGRGAALALAGQGAAVVVHGLDLAGAEQTAAEIADAGGRTVAVAGPIDDPETSEAAVGAALEHFGALDILVTSAGIQRYGDVPSTSLETWNEVFAVNVTGVFLAARAALPALRASGAGAIVIVSSVQATATQTQVAAYTASKGALIALTRSLAVDEAAQGVRVNSVSPGSVDTPMLRASAVLFGEGAEHDVEDVLANWGTAHPLGRIARADEIGEVVSFLSSPRASFVTGAELRVDGGLLARLAAAIPPSTTTA